VSNTMQDDANTSGFDWHIILLPLVQKLMPDFFEQ
jgi:hypothetical protein